MRSSRKDLKAFPEDAKGEIGHDLYLVQCGDQPEHSKPMQGGLSGVTEIRADSRDGNTYRAIYTVKLDPFVFVLHCFEKKSKRGVATPKRELDMIRRRLKEAQKEYEDLRRDQHAEGS